MGFHSFRNIGFSFVDAEAICSKWRRIFAGYNPEKAIRILGLTENAGCLYIQYFDKKYRLVLQNGVLEKRTDSGAAEKWTENIFMNEALVLYHLLGDMQESPRTAGEWIPEANLDPVKIRSGNRTDPMLNGFASQYAGRLPELERACIKAGGRKVERGDLCYEFRPFPQIPVQLVFYDADEEFSAKVQLLVDRYITDYMHFEAVGCMVADLLEKVDAKSLELYSYLCYYCV